MKADIQKAGRMLAAVLLIAVSLWAASFLIGRYGWKIQGISACTMEDVIIYEAEWDGSRLAVRGRTTASLPAYVGYVTETEGDTLYLGVKFNGFFGFLKRDGSFQIELDLAEGIHKVALKGQDGEKVIWESGTAG